MKTSNIFSLDLQDAVHGLIVAVGGAIVAAVESALTTIPVSFNYKQIALVALAAGVSYLGKKFFTSAKIVSDAVK
jgi:hypothetical protein